MISEGARALAIGCVLCGVVASAAAQSGDDEVRRVIEQAVGDYEAGRYPEAQALFRRAHELQPTARTLRGIGMASFEMRQYVEALRALRASLDDTRRPLTPEQRRQVEALITRAEAYVGRYRVEVEPAGATIRIDGATPRAEPDGTFLLDIGLHSVEAELAGHAPRTLSFRVEGGSQQTLRLTLAPTAAPEPDLPPPPSLRPEPTPEPTPEPVVQPVPATASVELAGPVVLFVLAGLAAGASVATGLFALQGQSDLAASCRYGVCPGSLLETQSRVQALALTTDALWVGAACAAAAGAVWLGIAATTAGGAAAPGPRAQLGCSPDGCGVSVTGAL